MKRLLVIIFSFTLVLMNFLYSKQKSKEIETEVLHPVRAITGDNDPRLAYKYFGFICTDENFDIYMSNNMKGYVLKMSRTGKFIRKIGRKGMGPGDLYLPYKITFVNGKIIVVDNNAFSIFDKQGRFIFKFRKFLPFETFTADSKYIYAYLPRKKNVITVFDYKGNRVRNFGELYENYKKVKMTFNIIHKLFEANIVVDNKNVYLIYLTPALIYKYDKKGKLLSRTEIVFKDKIINRIQNNLRYLIYKKGFERKRYSEEKYNHGELLRKVIYKNGKFYLLFSSLIDKKKGKIKGRILRLDAKTLKQEKMYIFYDISDKNYGKISKMEYFDEIAVGKEDGVEYFFIPIYSETEEKKYIGVYKTKK